MKAFEKYYIFLSDDISEKNIWTLKVISVEYLDFERKGRDVFKRCDSPGNFGQNIQLSFLFESLEQPM